MFFQTERKIQVSNKATLRERLAKAQAEYDTANGE